MNPNLTCVSASRPLGAAVDVCTRDRKDPAMNLPEGLKSSCHAMRCCGLALALFVVASAALADCVDGQRDPSPAEKAYIEKLKGSLMAVLPVAPAPLYMERKPRVSAGIGCGAKAPVGRIRGTVNTDYTASPSYADRVTVEVRTNYGYAGANDLVIGTLPKQTEPFKIHNVVVKFNGHNAQYVESLKQAIDRDQLQKLIDQPLPDTPPPVAWTVGAPTAAKASAAPTNSASATTTPSKPAAVSPSESAPPAPDPTQAVADKAKDAVNKLRGLFGR